MLRNVFLTRLEIGLIIRKFLVKILQITIWRSESIAASMQTWISRVIGNKRWVKYESFLPIMTIIIVNVMRSAVQSVRASKICFPLDLATSFACKSADKYPLETEKESQTTQLAVVRWCATNVNHRLLLFDARLWSVLCIFQSKAQLQSSRRFLLINEPYSVSHLALISASSARHNFTRMSARVFVLATFSHKTARIQIADFIFPSFFFSSLWVEFYLPDFALAFEIDWFMRVCVACSTCLSVNAHFDSSLSEAAQYRFHFTIWTE